MHISFTVKIQNSSVVSYSVVISFLFFCSSNTAIKSKFRTFYVKNASIAANCHIKQKTKFYRGSQPSQTATGKTEQIIVNDNRIYAGEILSFFFFVF